MKKLINTIALVSSGLTAQASDCNKNVHQWTVGIDIASYEYKEPKTNDFQGMKLKGFLGGLVLNYSFSPDSYQLNVNTRLLYGTTKYTGHFLGTGEHYAQKNIPNWMGETSVLGGPKFCFNSTTYIPMVGLGYRYKSDHASDPGYPRESNYWYVPVGLSVMHTLSDEWLIKGHIEYDHLLRGNNYTHGTDEIKQAYRQIHGKTLEPWKNKQKSGYGIKFEGSILKKMGNGTLSFGPYINYWNIDRSDHNAQHAPLVVLEPKNHTLEFGLKISYSF